MINFPDTYTWGMLDFLSSLPCCSTRELWKGNPRTKGGSWEVWFGYICLGRFFETGQFLYPCTCSVGHWNLLCFFVSSTARDVHILFKPNLYFFMWEITVVLSILHLYPWNAIYKGSQSSRPVSMQPFLMLLSEIFSRWTCHNFSACKTNCSCGKCLTAFLHSAAVLCVCLCGDFVRFF